MAPIQVIILLILIRLPEALRSADLTGHRPLAPAPPSGYSASWEAGILFSFFATQLLLVGFIWQQARAGIRRLDDPTVSGSAISSTMDHRMSLARWLTILITGTYLFVLHVPAIVFHWLDQTVMLKQIPLAADLLFLAPAMLTWVGFWSVNYFVEEASQRSMPYRLANQLPIHPMPPLGHYLSMQLRHNLFLAVPVGAACLVEDLGERLEPLSPRAGLFAGPAIQGVVVIIILLMAPWLITRIWTTLPLRGELRARLDAVAARYRLRFRNILVWKTHNAVTNAAILGYIPFSRYFLMTDALLETLTDQQIEAVFAHEVGHGVHRHMLWYLVGMLGSMAVCQGATVLLVCLLPVQVTAWFGGADTLGSVLWLVLFAIIGIVGFSYVSHRFEHQADWFASKHMARMITEHPATKAIPAAEIAEVPDDPLDDASPPAASSARREAHEPPLPPAADRVTLTEYVQGQYPHAGTAATTAEPRAIDPARAGAEVFVSALDTIIDITHRSRTRGGWMHPSVNHRIDLLRRLAASPAEESAFNRRMYLTRVAVMSWTCMGVMLVLISWLGHPKPAEAVPPSSPPAATQPVAGLGALHKGTGQGNGHGESVFATEIEGHSL